MKINRRNLSASVARPFGRQNCADFHLERLRQNDQFGIRDAAKLRFYLGKRSTAQIPAEDRTAGGEHFLRQPLLVAQLPDLRPDNVLWFGHAPKTELDTKTSGELNCSIIGAT